MDFLLDNEVHRVNKNVCKKIKSNKRKSGVLILSNFRVTF